MSRKARIRDEEKDDWDRVRLYIASSGYGPLKPTPTAFHGATVVLWDGEEDRAGPLGGLLAHVNAARDICLDHQGGGDQSVVVVDLSALRRRVEADAATDTATYAATAAALPRSEATGKIDDDCKNVISKERKNYRAAASWKHLLEAEGATREELGKVVGRPVAKALTRLMMTSVDGSVTLVARGLLAAVALKIMRTPDVRAAGCRVARLVLVTPVLPKALVNALLTGDRSNNDMTNSQKSQKH